MIVKRVWSKYISAGLDKSLYPKYFKFQGGFYRGKTEHWQGYFLFGFIPLYLEITKVVYIQG